MTDTTLRLWAMLRQIPHEPRFKSTAEICQALHKQGYSISKRSVERDLLAMEPEHGYRCECRGRTNHWTWPKHAASLDIPGLDPASALVLSMARGHLETVLPATALELLNPYFEGAERVLSEQPGNKLAAWRNKVRVLTRGPQLRPTKVPVLVQHAIYDGLLHGRQVKGIYRAAGAGSKPREAIFHPLALVVRDGVIYLIATEWNYTVPYHYALHRFLKAELLPDPANTAKDFDLDSYIQNQAAFSYPTSKGKIRLELEWSKNAALHLIERPLSDDQTVREIADGRIRVRGTVIDTKELRWWILGFGDQVEVLAPTALRKSISATSQAMARKYNR